MTDLASRLRSTARFMDSVHADDWPLELRSDDLRRAADALDVYEKALRFIERETYCEDGLAFERLNHEAQNALSTAAGGGEPKREGSDGR